jgi:hypothetical protein
MKKGILASAIVSVVIGGGPLSFNRQDSVFTQESSLTGRVSPADAAEMIWVIGGKDSLKTWVVSGIFSLKVKPGKYKLLVDAKLPYKDVLLDNLEIKLNQTLDIGEIILQQ